MDSSFWFDTINLGLPIVLYSGVRGYNFHQICTSFSYLQTVKTHMKCHIMWHFIRVFTVCESAHLRSCQKQRWNRHRRQWKNGLVSTTSFGSSWPKKWPCRHFWSFTSIVICFVIWWWTLEAYIANNMDPDQTWSGLYSVCFHGQALEWTNNIFRGTDKSPLGQKLTGTKAHCRTKAYWTKAHC